MFRKLWRTSPWAIVNWALDRFWQYERQNELHDPIQSQSSSWGAAGWVTQNSRGGTERQGCFYRENRYRTETEYNKGRNAAKDVEFVVSIVYDGMGKAGEMKLYGNAASYASWAWSCRMGMRRLPNRLLRSFDYLIDQLFLYLQQLQWNHCNAFKKNRKMGLKKAVRNRFFPLRACVHHAANYSCKINRGRNEKQLEWKER